MSDQELLEFIAAQEKHLKDALAQLGRMRARIVTGMPGTVITINPRVSVAVSADDVNRASKTVV